MEDRWNPLTVEEVADRFGPFGVDWWLAGGLAIDCFVGWKTREHADIDVEMFRSDGDVLFDVFDGWELFAVGSGEHARWERREPIPKDVFGIWGRPSAGAPWGIEIILAEGDRSLWRFRRDPEITLEGSSLVKHTSSGIPYCTPEVQLLYKAKQARPKDDVDLTRTLHHMSRSQRVWLVEAIRRDQSHHPWVAVLELVDVTHHE